MQCKQAKIGVGVCALLVLLGLSLVGFASDLRVNRPAMPRAGGAPAASPAGPSSLSTAIYLKVAGIDGESTDKEHAGWSHALSFSQSLTVPTGPTAGQAAGRAVPKTIVVTKLLDKAGPKLGEAAGQNAHQKKVWIDVTRGNKTVYAYELTDVMVTEYEVSGATGAQGFPTEEITFSFNEMKVTYTEYDAGGAPKGTVTYSTRGI